MGQLTTHILDTSIGKPARDVKVKLEFLKNNDLIFITENVTNSDGRIPSFTDNINLEYGHYKITFEIKEYFDSLNTKCFYPHASIDFIIDSDDHYHVPLLLNPYGYSTYRGS